MIITTEPTHYPDADLQEASNRHDNASAVVRTIATALDTIPRLCAEIHRLRSRLASTLSDLHNLIAAARATLNAHVDGETDAFYYLRDELQAQGQLPPEHRDEQGERP